MREVDKMNQGKLYHPFSLEVNSWHDIREAIKEFNESRYWEDRGPLDNLRSYFKQSYDDLSLIPPFYCDHGIHISIGRHFQGNTGLLILDEGEVCIGDDVLIGPRVSIYTVNHPMDPDFRKKDLEYAKSVRIEDGVWIAGNVVINSGVHIGKGSVIGSGSVVTRDIPALVFAAGNPCRVIRKITKEERQTWKERYERENQDE